jgi:hypothetical protein
MGATRPPEPSVALVGQDGLRATPVRRAVAAGDEPVGFEPVDQARHPAPAEHDPVGQLIHPEPAIGRLGELEERHVLGQGQLLLGPEVVVEPSADERVRGQEGAPGREPGIPRAQPADPIGRDILVGRLAHGQHHTRCPFG